MVAGHCNQKLIVGMRQLLSGKIVDMVSPNFIFYMMVGSTYHAKEHRRQNRWII